MMAVVSLPAKMLEVAIEVRARLDMWAQNLKPPARACLRNLDSPVRFGPPSSTFPHNNAIAINTLETKINK
jgi:hypothetical protein